MAGRNSNVRLLYLCFLLFQTVCRHGPTILLSNCKCVRMANMVNRPSQQKQKTRTSDHSLQFKNSHIFDTYCNPSLRINRMASGLVHRLSCSLLRFFSHNVKHYCYLYANPEDYRTMASLDCSQCCLNVTLHLQGVKSYSRTIFDLCNISSHRVP